MFRMTSDAVKALQPASATKSTPGVANRPSRLDHVHSVLGMEQILFHLTAADLNVLTDQAFIKRWNFANYLISRIHMTNASGSITAADGGIYQAAAKAGNALVAAAQVYTAIDAVTKGMDLTLTAFAKGVLTATPILSLTGTQGGAMTADIYIFGVPLTEGV